MASDLPPNLQQAKDAIVRAAEQTPKLNLPSNPNSQVERNRKNEVRDAGNRNAAEKNRSGEQRPK